MYVFVFLFSNSCLSLLQSDGTLSCSYHGDEAPDELEVLEVVGVDVGGGVDLQTVVVLAGIFEQAVHGVEHFVREQEEPFPGCGGDTMDE